MAVTAQQGNVVITGTMNSKQWTGIFTRPTTGHIISTGWNGNILSSKDS